MRERLLDLYAVQQIDLEIREIERKRDGIPVRLNEQEAEIADNRKQVTQLKDESANLTKEIKTLEGAVAAEAQKIRLWEKRLNDIRNQREYLALSRETESSKRANRSNEEQIIEWMGKREEIDGRMESLNEQLAEREQASATEREQVQTALAEAESTVAEHKAHRDGLLHKIPASLLRKYDQIRKKRAEMGSAPAADGRCTACNMRLPPQLYNILQRVDSIEQCPSCQRILFYIGILTPPEVEASEEAVSESVEATS